MGSNKFEEIPEMSTPQTADVMLYKNPKKGMGILLITNNKFFKRLWYMITNPFRYLFTGKIRY